jgi:hypothetical protein
MSTYLLIAGVITKFYSASAASPLSKCLSPLMRESQTQALPADKHIQPTVGHYDTNLKFYVCDVHGAVFVYYP